jgi:hypothetical protein
MEGLVKETHERVLEGVTGYVYDPDTATPRPGTMSLVSSASSIERSAQTRVVASTKASFKGTSVNTYSTLCTALILQLLSVLEHKVHSNNLKYLMCSFQEMRC